MPETDLFKSKTEQVLDFIMQRGRARTSDVAKFGVSIYHPDRACRDARDWAKKGKIGRMRQDLKETLYGDTKEDVWSAYPADWEKYVR